MNILGIVLLLSLPAAMLCAKCTRPHSTTNEPPPPTTNRPDPPTTDTVVETTTEIFDDTTTSALPAPESWPQGKFSLLMAGDSCPDFYAFRTGYIYQDTEDFRNANSWPRNSRGFKGPMKQDGFYFHFCTKNKGTGDYAWPEGNYCINKFSGKCPSKFQTGNITWDDENDNNENRVKGRTPGGQFGDDTTLYYCCRNDGDFNRAIDLPITKPFYMYPFEGGCQKVRRMFVTREVIQFDDEDTSNKNSKGGSHPKLGESPWDHLMTFCLYEPAL